jgi:signal transduction histidine kinase
MAETVRSVEAGASFAMEYRMVAADGRLVWVRDEATQILQDDSGKVMIHHGVLVDITEMKRMEEELRTRWDQLQAATAQRQHLLSRLVAAQEDERRQIASNIHDDPVQKMAALKMRLELFRKKHPDLPDMNEALDVMRVTIRSMRTLLFDLSPPTLEEEGLGSSLAYLLEHSNPPFDWEVDADELDEEPAVQTSLILYRIAQEAFANARKHAEASGIRVTLQPRDDGTLMQIIDDGVGFVPQDAIVAAPGHLGLAAIRERADMAGGWSTLWSLPGEGTTLEVWLPREGSDVPTPAQDEGVPVANVLPLSDRAARRRATAEVVSSRAVGSDRILGREEIAWDASD